MNPTHEDITIPARRSADAASHLGYLHHAVDAAQHRQAMTATDSIPVDALIRYAETEASAAEARAAGAGSDLFKRSNQHIWAAWSAFAGNLRTYSIEEMQAMADEDLTEAKGL